MSLNTDLVQACASGNLSLAKRLVEDGARVDVFQNASSKSPIEAAMSRSQLDIVRWLLTFPEVSTASISYYSLYEAYKSSSADNFPELLQLLAETPSLRAEAFSTTRFSALGSFCRDASSQTSTAFCQKLSILLDPPRLYSDQHQAVEYSTSELFKLATQSAVDSSNFRVLELLIKHPMFNLQKALHACFVYENADVMKFFLQNRKASNRYTFTISAEVLSRALQDQDPPPSDPSFLRFLIDDLPALVPNWQPLEQLDLAPLFERIGMYDHAKSSAAADFFLDYFCPTHNPSALSDLFVQVYSTPESFISKFKNSTASLPTFLDRLYFSPYFSDQAKEILHDSVKLLLRRACEATPLSQDQTHVRQLLEFSHLAGLEIPTQKLVKTLMKRRLLQSAAEFILAAQRGFISVDDCAAELLPAAASHSLASTQFLIDNYADQLTSVDFSKACITAAGADRLDVIQHLESCCVPSSSKSLPKKKGGPWSLDLARSQSSAVYQAVRNNNLRLVEYLVDSCQCWRKPRLSKIASRLLRESTRHNNSDLETFLRNRIQADSASTQMSPAQLRRATRDFVTQLEILAGRSRGFSEFRARVENSPLVVDLWEDTEVFDRAYDAGSYRILGYFASILSGVSNDAFLELENFHNLRVYLTQHGDLFSNARPKLYRIFRENRIPQHEWTEQLIKYASSTGVRQLLQLKEVSSLTELDAVLQAGGRESSRMLL